MNRRSFLQLVGGGAATTALQTTFPLATFGQAKHSHISPATPVKPVSKAADHVIRIQETNLEIAPGVQVKTVTYNGQVPGPLLRMKHGVRVTVDVINQSKVPELLHWHGFDIDPINDGAMEEGSPMIDPGKTLRYAFTPNLTGSRWYHTHAGAEKDLTLSTYTGQLGFAFVEPVQDPGHYDHEVFLAIHHWNPKLEMQGPPVNGCEVSYEYATFNGKQFSATEPLKVKHGERVLFHFLNASATQNSVLALPGHQFEVLALDGNPVPTPAKVDTIAIAVAERVDAIVEMNQPGVWMLGATDRKERESGLGFPIEYIGSTGTPQWKDPKITPWDYLLFGKPGPVMIKPDESHNMVFGKKAGGALDGMDLWMINGKAWPEIPALEIKKDSRVRLSMLNASPEFHPIHLHRHSFEVMSINGKPSSGVMKDTLNLPPFGRAEVDFIANNPGPTLFHCHQQLHMDYGFMQLFKYV